MGPDKQQQYQLGLPVTSASPWRWKGRDEGEYCLVFAGDVLQFAMFLQPFERLQAQLRRTAYKLCWCGRL